MGEVWLGHHREQGTAVAVKVLTAREAREGANLKAIRNEVRAVASLDHPGIIWVFDQGELGPETAAARVPGLTEGAPYLVMELSSGGTLGTLRRALGWPELRTVAMVLLDALAHAHAHGVIHRDLKPANVLLSGAGDLRPGLKLTDFGIAHASEDTIDDSLSGRVIGTLHYMSPEQIRADWRDYGPWTDLYALGCILYRLASGRQPFGGRKGASLMAAQLYQEPPELLPRIEVPPGFEAWLGTLLQKETYRRVQCAADAAAALIEVDPAAALPLSETISDGEEILGPVRPRALVGRPRMVAFPDAQPSRARLRAPLPKDWRRGDEGVRPPRLIGTGLGLLGLRPVPLVGREAERDALWAALDAVHQTGKPRAVLLHGAGGSGKTRLAQWVADAGTESGGAVSLRHTYMPSDAPGEGLRRMLWRFFRVSRLSAEARLVRVNRVLDGFGVPDEGRAKALSGLLEPRRGDEAGLLPGAARYELVRWWFSKVARDRPLILIFDNAHGDLDALRFIEHVLDAEQPTPVLMVAVIQDESLALLPAEQARVAALSARAEVSRQDLAPLNADQLKRLVQDALVLVPSLVQAIVDRAEGSPQFTLQLLDEWVRQGALVRGPGGYALDEAAPALPASVADLWAGRVRGVLAGSGEVGALVAERAAVLGMDVDPTEWQCVVDDPQAIDASQGRVMFRPELARVRQVVLDAMLGAQLVLETDEGWRFAHDQVRAVLIQQAREAGRIAQHHAAVAAMLSVHPEHEPARLAEHLMAAGAAPAAVGPMLAAASQRARSVGPRAGLQHLEGLDAALTQAGMPGSDGRWGELWVLRAELLHRAGEAAVALRWAHRALAAATGRAWGRVGPRAAYLLGELALEAADLEEAETRFRQAEALAEADERLVGFARWRRVEISTRLGEQEAADSHRVTAMRALKRQAERAGDLAAHLALARLARDAKDKRGALAHARVARDAAQRNAELAWLAEAWMLLGSIGRSVGNLGAARQALEAAVAARRNAGEAANAELLRELALLALAEGEAGAAREAVRRALGAERCAQMLAALAVVEAREAQWPACRDALFGLEDELVRTRERDVEVVACLAQVATCCEAASEAELAGAAGRISAQASGAS